MGYPHKRRPLAAFALALGLGLATAPQAAEPDLIGPGAAGSGDESVPQLSGPGHTTQGDVDAYMRAAVARAGLKGASVIVGRCAGRGHFVDVYRGDYGAYTPDTIEPIASVTKWYSAVVVASEVDRGRLRFDDPIGKLLPEVPADKRAIPLRLTLAHVSGLTDLPIQDEETHADLADSARHILSLPTRGAPGSVFVYSGTAMQAAGRAAEITSGKPFRTLFAERVAAPLGLKVSAYRAFSGGRTAPALGGDMVSTPAEMERFTQMIAGHGSWRGRRIVLQATLDDMQRPVSLGAAPLAVPKMAQRFPAMATGMWCEKISQGRCTSVAAIGAYGAYAWVDYGLGLYGVMFVKDDPGKILRQWRAIRRAAEREAGPGRC